MCACVQGRKEGRKEGREEARKAGRQGKEASLYIHVHTWIGAMKAGCKYGRLVWKAEESVNFFGPRLECFRPYCPLDVPVSLR